MDRRSQRWRSAAAVGWGLIALAIVWWVQSFAANYLTGPAVWFYPWHTLGTDFMDTFRAVHFVAAGGNPYRHDFGDYRGLYPYPPIVIGLFYWSVLFPLSAGRAAAMVWTTAVGVLVSVAAIAATRNRRRLGLTAIPAPLAVGAALLSTPVVFAMERGNCDAIVLILVLAAASLILRRSRWANAAAGACLAVAMWVKIYPGLVLLSAATLRRWQVVGWGVAVGLLIPVLLWRPTADFIHASRTSEGYRISFIQSATHLESDPKVASSGKSLTYPPLEASSHSLPIYWRTFCTEIGAPAIGKIPGLLGAGILLGPLLAIVLWKTWGTREPYPLLLWIAMLATFWLPVSYDYNLVFFPVLAAAVWDWREAWYVQCLLAPAILYWQPFELGVPKEALLAFKLMALVGLGICVCRRASRLGKVPDLVNVA